MSAENSGSSSAPSCNMASGTGRRFVNAHGALNSADLGLTRPGSSNNANDTSQSQAPSNDIYIYMSTEYEDVIYEVPYLDLEDKIDSLTRAPPEYPPPQLPPPNIPPRPASETLPKLYPSGKTLIQMPCQTSLISPSRSMISLNTVDNNPTFKHTRKSSSEVISTRVLEQSSALSLQNASQETFLSESCPPPVSPRNVLSPSESRPPPVSPRNVLPPSESSPPPVSPRNVLPPWQPTVPSLKSSSPKQCSWESIPPPLMPKNSPLSWQTTVPSVQSSSQRQSLSESIPPPVLPKNSPLSWQTTVPSVQSSSQRQSLSESIPPPVMPKNSPLSWQTTSPSLQYSSRSNSKSYPENMNQVNYSVQLSPNTTKAQVKYIKDPASKSDPKPKESGRNTTSHHNMPRRASQLLKTKVARIAKTLKGSLNSTMFSQDNSDHEDVCRVKENNDLEAGKHSIERGPSKSPSSSSRKSDTLPSSARPSSELVQKLETALRNIPSLMMVTQKGWDKNEPMYQFYAATANHTQHIHDGHTEDDIYDIYKEWTDWPEKEHYNSTSLEASNSARKVADKTEYPGISATNSEIIMTSNMAVRTLWKDLPVVQQDPTACSLSKQQRNLQEIKFEILATEASYIKSLTVLQEHFIQNPELARETVLPKKERRTLFHHVRPVYECSLRFMADLEICWEESIFLSGLFDVVLKHSREYFHVYVAYCSQQSAMAHAYKTLMERNDAFVSAVKYLESHPGSGKLPLHSFLLLPLQRITRLLLLVENAKLCLGKKDDEHRSCQLSLNQLKQIVYDCNEGARVASRRRERMEDLGEKLDYMPGVEPFSMVSASRWLVMSGDMTKYDWRTENTYSISKNKYRPTYKINKTTVRLILLSDLLVVAKKKSDEYSTVLDYGQRSMVRADEGVCIDYLPPQLKLDSPKKYIIVVSMFENHDGKYAEMVLSCALESDRDQWLEALTPYSENGVVQAPEIPRHANTVPININCIANSPIDDVVPQKGDALTVIDNEREGVYDTADQQEGIKIATSQLGTWQLHSQTIKELQEKFAKEDVMFV